MATTARISSRTRNALFFRNLDPQTKQRFKLKCMKKGVSMQVAIEALMRLFIDKPKAAKPYLSGAK